MLRSPCPSSSLGDLLLSALACTGEGALLLQVEALFGGKDGIVAATARCVRPAGAGAHGSPSFDLRAIAPCAPTCELRLWGELPSDLSGPERESLLARQGCTATIVDNGELAFEAAATDEFDAILMDCNMPVMDGFEATRNIRSLHGRRSQIPILALTASALPEDKRRCLESGMDGSLTKPLVRKDLEDALRCLVDPPGEELDAA